MRDYKTKKSLEEYMQSQGFKYIKDMKSHFMVDQGKVKYNEDLLI